MNAENEDNPEEQQEIAKTFSFLEEESRPLSSGGSKPRKAKSRKFGWPIRILFLSLHAALVSLVLMWAGRIPTPDVLHRLKNLIHDVTKPEDRQFAKNGKVQAPQAQPDGLPTRPLGTPRRAGPVQPNPASPPDSAFETFGTEEADSPLDKAPGDKTGGQESLSEKRGVPKKSVNPPAAPVNAEARSRIERLRAQIATLENQHIQNQQIQKQEMLRKFDRTEKMVRVEGKSWVEAGELAAAQRIEWLRTIEAERKVFADDQEYVPRSRLMLDSLIDYQLGLHKTRRPLIMKYENLLKELPDANRLAECAEPMNRQKEHDRQAAEVVGFQPGSVWTGTRFAKTFNFNNGQMNEAVVPFELRVIRVENDILEAEAIFANDTARAAVRGHFDGVRVEWQTVQMTKPDGAERRWFVAGVVLGSTLYARVSGTNANTTNNSIIGMDGFLQLERRN